MYAERQSRNALYETGVGAGAGVRRAKLGEVTDFKSVKYVGFPDPDGRLWPLQELPPECGRRGQSFYRSDD